MTNDRLSVKKHLFLTGEKQVGKSTLLRRLIKAKELDYAGFETQAFYLNGERRGFTLHGHVEMPPYENDCICCVRVEQQKSIPVLPVFEKNGVTILQKSLSSASPYILMDELGKLEQHADSFIKQLYACLDADKRVIGVLQKCHSEHVDAISRRDDVTVLTVTPQNREMLFDQLLNSL